METGAITDGQISASSEYSAFLAAVRGRLNVQHSPGKGGSWSARNLDRNQWLQIDVGSPYTKVTRVATQGRSGSTQWVKKYMLLYNNDEGEFNGYKQQYHTTYKVMHLIYCHCHRYRCCYCCCCCYYYYYHYYYYSLLVSPKDSTKHS